MSEMDHLADGKNAKIEEVSGQQETQHLARSLVPVDDNFVSDIAVYLAIATLIMVVAFLAICTFIDISLAAVGSMSALSHALDLAGTTTLATCVTLCTVGQLKRLWLADILTWRSHDAYPGLLRSGKVLLRVSTVLEVAKGWEMTLSLMATGLVTTAIVTAVTPTQIDRVWPGATLLQTDGKSDVCLVGSDSRPNTTVPVCKLQDNTWLRPSLLDGTIIAMLSRLTQPWSTSGYAYTVGGSIVATSAAGVPMSLGHSTLNLR